MGRPLSTGIVVLALLTGGCIGFIDYPPYVEVSFDGTMQATNGSFDMSGQILVSGIYPEDPPEAFHDVAVSLYGPTEDRLCTREVGTLTVDGSAEERRENVSLSWPRIPSVVRITGADFWSQGGTDSDVQVNYFVLQSRGTTGEVTGEPRYVEEFADSPGDLPTESATDQSQPCRP